MHSLYSLHFFDNYKNKNGHRALQKVSKFQKSAVGPSWFLVFWLVSN